MRLRVVVANIQSGIGITKGYRQYLSSGWRYLLPHDGRGVMGAGSFLKAEDADLALLTEVDAGSRRSRGVAQLDVIAEEAGLPHARYFPTKQVGASIREGSAVLSRFPIVEDRALPLLSRMNPRVLGETRLALPEGRGCTALIAHLALGSRPREAQIAAIAARIKGIEGPVMLGGDFNERDHEAFGLLTRIGLTPVSVPGYPSWNPLHALQVLFVSRDFRVRQVAAPDGARFSDHLPLIVALELD
jgi:endonuclease/exonuclease/phosphatase family metal-dependent hydrolase